MLLLEKNIFMDNEVSSNTSDNIKIYCAKSITDECCQTAREIRTLLRKGYRANDIAIITRDIDKYRDELSVIFKKYDIPFYNDERQPIKNQPLVVFIEYLLRCVNYSLRSDDIISLAKTSLKITYICGI
jgi:ATP-dependent helicase/nuclease subunit B